MRREVLDDRKEGENCAKMTSTCHEMQRDALLERYF